MATSCASTMAGGCYSPKIKSTIIDSRNIAIDQKREKQLEGDSEEADDVPNDIQIPKHYTKL